MLGMSEILIIAAIALVVLGPEKFPEFAKIALRAFRDLRGYVDDIKREMADELNPVKNEIQKLAQYNPEEYITPITEAFSQADTEVKEAVSTANTELTEALTDTYPTESEPSSPDSTYEHEPEVQDYLDAHQEDAEPATESAPPPQDVVSKDNAGSEPAPVSTVQEAHPERLDG